MAMESRPKLFTHGMNAMGHVGETAVYPVANTSEKGHMVGQQEHTDRHEDESLKDG